MKVFVYGTLKHGYGNHHLLERSTRIGSGETVAHCRLYDAGFPVLRPRDKKPERNAKVRGEVYDCDEATVMELDRLESEGRMYHRRTKLIRLDSGQRVKAAAYIGDTWFWKHNQRLMPLRHGKYEWPNRRAT
jgi:gamma-glutamylaminecyclotransferase